MSASDNNDLTTDIPGFKESFLKSQVSSIASTIVDFTVLVILTEFFAVYYVHSKGIAAICGAVIGFFLGRNWAFRSQSGSLKYQSFKYILVSAVSWFLNVKGIYLLTEHYNLHYFVSNVIVAIIVAVFFNFIMYRYFVFK